MKILWTLALGTLFGLSLAPQSVAASQFGQGRERNQSRDRVCVYQDIRFQGCNVLADLRRNLEAIASYSEAIKLRPDYEQAFVNRATILIVEGQVENAIADLKNAIHLNKKDIIAYINLASAYRMTRATATTGIR